MDSHSLLWRDRVHAHRVSEVVDCPYVLVIHDDAFAEVVSEKTSLEKHLGWISGAVCMSDVIRTALESRVPGIRATRSSPLLTTAPQTGGESWGEPLAGFLDRHSPLIVAGGALAEHYGLTDVLRAFATLRESRRNTGLVLLLGSLEDESPQAAALREDVKHLGQDAVLLLSDFPDGDRLIAHGDVYVRTSRVDGFGPGLHEAMQAGVPVVEARHGPRPDGVLPYEPGNVEALVAALEQSLTPEAVEAARVRIASLAEDLENNRRATLEFLGSLLE